MEPLAGGTRPEEQRLHLVVYIDNQNIRPVHRNRVLGELAYFLLHELSPEDRVMLLSFDRSLKVRRTFTSDPRLIASALDELERVTGGGTNQDTSRRDALERIENASGVDEALIVARQYAEEVQNDLGYTLDALRATIENLAGLPGRKAILYVSDGIPMVAGQDIFAAVDEKFGGMSSAMIDSVGYDASRRFAEVANLANANRVTFYTVDATGLRVQSAFSAENMGPGFGPRVESSYTSNQQSSLRYLADATGGVAVVNTNRILPRLEQVAEDFGSYYSLGFSPAHAGTGRFHDLRVEVKGRKGLVVRHREGYRDKTIESVMTDGTISALHYPYQDNPLGVRLRFGEPTRNDRRYYTVPVDVEVPLGKVVLLPRAGTHEARLRVFLGVIDAQGDSSPIQQVPLSISVPDAEVEQARGQFYRYRLSLIMRAGAQRVAVGLRDELGGEASFVTDQVTVGAR